jgi:hypothetical protein
LLGATGAFIALNLLTHTALFVKPAARRFERLYPARTPLRLHMESEALKTELEKALPKPIDSNSGDG